MNINIHFCQKKFLYIGNEIYSMNRNKRHIKILTNDSP